MSANLPKLAQPAPPNDRRRDSLQREAYAQRDRSKRMGTTATEAKSTSKLDHVDSTFGRFI